VDPTAQFAQNLRRLRLAAGLTQEQLSDVTQLAPSEISRYERGGRDPQLQQLVRLSRGLQVPLAELIADIE
jgi:transcriptional regulator with XRE-family HTH domain